MMNVIAGCQPNAVLPSRSCCCVYPRISEKVMLQIQSSIGASVMVAITTTPLEVVKTRLQIAPASFHHNSKRPLFSKSLSSHGHSPCDGSQEGNRMLSRLSSLDSTSHRPGPFNVVKTILKKKGIGGLWTGTGAAIIHAVPSVSIYLVCYEQLKAKFEEIKTPSALTPVLAGALSRSISVLITSPLDLVRTRKMAADSVTPRDAVSLARSVADKRMGVMSVMRQLVAENGWRCLWRGVGASLWRDVPFSALYWFSAEQIRHRLQAVSGGPVAGTSGTLSVNLASGMLAGALASVVSHPFDVVKTQRMATRDHGPAAPRGRAAAPAEGTMGLIRRAVAEEGLATLWKGLGVRLVKVPVSCAVALASFEAFKAALQGQPAA
uniref:Mitochondrial carrier protein n=1 Tax=Cryptomonas curvata TaxID=233186 RepID=A0A7S0MJW1_9CRYP|mmetsp:Transcript_44870/g.93996  ORF Transcript_44870/g.93996 Transcript_44870/m.93996 type:complete len:379 (+) Transcript_44870:48-1184(+)